MTPDRKVKVLIAKPGLDGHDIGIKLVARMLRDAGIEVVYLGIFQTPESIVASAIDEDVDAIGLSFIGGDHLVHTPKVIKLLRDKNAHIPVILGGVIPRQDFPTLKEMGVKAIFEAGSPVDSILHYIEENIRSGVK